MLREFLRHSGVPVGSWGVPNNNGGPRLKILRGSDSITSQINCFQGTYQDDPTEECTRSFVTVLLEHGIYFRAPTADEVDRLSAFADAQIDKELANSEINRRKTIVRAAWMTRGALFHDEPGQGDELPDGRRSLSDRELAQALSLALGDHIAGVTRSGYINEEGEDNRHLQDVHEAAIAGVLNDPATIEALVRKHMAGIDPASVDPDAPPSSYPVGSADCKDQYWMSHKLRGFFREWIDYNHVTSIFKDTPEATSRFNDGTLLKTQGRSLIYPSLGKTGHMRMSNLFDTLAGLAKPDLDHEIWKWGGEPEKAQHGGPLSELLL